MALCTMGVSVGGEQVPEIESIVEDNKWRVDGSKGNHYWVEWHPFHKHYSCGCKGYAFRKSCRHITEVSNQFKNNLKNRLT